MDNIWKNEITQRINALRAGSPSGDLLKSIDEFEIRMKETADANEGNPDVEGVLEKTGLNDDYRDLYLAVMSGANDYSLPERNAEPEPQGPAAENGEPTVHSLMASYRAVYDSMKPTGKKKALEAYQKILDVENRTNDFIEAQYIMEKEDLNFKALLASYRDDIDDFARATDPNFRMTRAAVSSTVGQYALAKSVDEITYRGEISKGCNTEMDAMVIPMLMINFYALLFKWDYLKFNIHNGYDKLPDNVGGMMRLRENARDYYGFMSGSMGITWDDIEKDPYFRILMLDPKPLDSMWRLKKVAPPENIAAMRTILFDEILSDRPLEDILAAPKDYVFYWPLDDEGSLARFEEVAAELNRDRGPYLRDDMGKKLEELSKQESAGPDAASRGTLSAMSRTWNDLHYGGSNMQAGGLAGTGGMFGGGSGSGFGSGSGSGFGSGTGGGPGGNAGSGSASWSGVAEGASLGTAGKAAGKMLKGLFRKK